MFLRIRGGFGSAQLLGASNRRRLADSFFAWNSRNVSFLGYQEGGEVCVAGVIRRVATRLQHSKVDKQRRLKHFNCRFSQ